MSDMVEQVARKLCERAIRVARRWDTPADELEANLAAGVEHAWRDYAEEARVAIEAMREPTEAMIRARWPSYHPWGENAPYPDDRAGMYEEMTDKTKALWRTMIDAALSPLPDNAKG